VAIDVDGHLGAGVPQLFFDIDTPGQARGPKLLTASA
jgi:hypothetical protein